MESDSTESAQVVQEVLDVVPLVDGMAERAAGPTNDTDHEIGCCGHQSSSCGIRLFGRCGLDCHVQDPGACYEVSS